MRLARERLNAKGGTYLDRQTHLSIPPYKEEALDKDSWHTQKGRPATPLGCAWLRLYPQGAGVSYDVVFGQ